LSRLAVALVEPTSEASLRTLIASNRTLKARARDTLFSRVTTHVRGGRNP
jgi:hypothetical protein